MKRQWCIGQITSQFIAAMERILWLYSLPYDPAYPVVCFDERPCFLIGDKVEPIALQTGQVKKEHYAYEKHGSCALLAAIEPLTGNRVAQVQLQRTKKEFTLICQAIAAAYPHAKQIRLVLDNLNTHTTGAFYDHLPADEAWALAQRFVFYHTPKSASWLNMIEIEFSALARLCLDCRIPTMAKLEKEVLTFLTTGQNSR
ncbi:MAG: IS630 family transposase [Ardenticatenaceae bacterium]|nr:IS630 family transposase [Ardenticatenaceae bacterium]